MNTVQMMPQLKHDAHKMAKAAERVAALSSLAPKGLIALLTSPAKDSK